MSKKQNSKKQFKDFIKEKGIFAGRKAEKEAKDKELEGLEKKDKKPLRYYLGRYISAFKDQKSKLVLVMLMGLSGAIFGAVFPWTSKIMIDYILPQKNSVLLIAACIFLFLTMAMRNILALFQEYINQRMLGKLVLELKRSLMSHLQTLPLVELQKLKTGGIITRIQEDTEGAGNLLFHGLLTPFNAFCMFLITIVSLLMISWKVTIICVFFVGLMFIAAYCFFYIMRPFQRALLQERSMINAYLTESFGGIQVVKSFRRENTVKRNYGTDVNLLWRKSLFALVASMSVHRSIWFIDYGAVTVIWLVGGYYYIKGILSVGDVVVFITFLDWLFGPIFWIMASFSEMQKSIACTERTIDLLDMEPDIVDKDDAHSVKNFEKGISFENVSFKYPDGTLALEDINVAIPKGKVTALVGPSGGGKTTLTNLVLRFYDVTSGHISLDDKDIRDIKLANYRSLISLVLQDVFLFDGTVRENIMFGKKDASHDEVVHAAKVAHCDEFIDKLKDKYDTVIGERGVKLSGGQKQRIALARAIIANPQLLILDEATSNLDSESEGLIQDALKHIFKGRTSLVIAHRLSTIMDADNIIVIDKGRIAEQGRHDQLLDAKGKYYEMYTKQMEKARSFVNIWNDSSSNENPEAKEKTETEG